MKQRAALTISYILMPTTFAVVAFPLLVFLTPQNSDRAVIVVVSVLFGAVLPFLYLLLLLHRQRVTRLDVPVREQRTIPYLVTVVIYFAGSVLLYVLGASVIVSALMLCYATNTLVISAINTRWKISAHAMGASGPLTALAVTFGWLVLPFFLIVPIVAWARVELKAHTRAQVVAGAFLGIILTAVQVQALYKIAGAG
ncbi:MAG: PAP2 family protein [Bacteroidetes bacterium]|nr:PAP2 family protein [Bacteroidota bacterium]